MSLVGISRPSVSVASGSSEHRGLARLPLSLRSSTLARQTTRGSIHPLVGHRQRSQEAHATPRQSGDRESALVRLVSSRSPLVVGVLATLAGVGAAIATAAIMHYVSRPVEVVVHSDRAPLVRGRILAMKDVWVTPDYVEDGRACVRLLRAHTKGGEIVGVPSRVDGGACRGATIEFGPKVRYQRVAPAYVAEAAIPAATPVAATIPMAAQQDLSGLSIFENKPMTELRRVAGVQPAALLPTGHWPLFAPSIGSALPNLRPPARKAVVIATTEPVREVAGARGGVRHVGPEWLADWAREARR